MSSDISPENERFIRDAVETGLFQDRRSALDAAIDLLKRRMEQDWHEFIQQTYGSCAELGLEEPADLPLPAPDWPL